MARGLKSEMPEVIFVIFVGYEIRYYTTAESFAEGLIDYGVPGSQIEVFFPSKMVDDSIARKVKQLIGKHPSWLFNSPRVDKWGNSTAAQLKSQNAAKRAWLKRKREYKANILAQIQDIVGGA